MFCFSIKIGNFNWDIIYTYNQLTPIYNFVSMSTDFSSEMLIEIPKLAYPNSLCQSNP